MKDKVQAFLDRKNEHEIDYRSPAKHFYSLQEHYAPLQEGIAGPANFFDSTIVLYQEVEQPKRKPDFTSGSGSRYWFTKKGVVRGSDHWGNHVANCDWALKLKNGKTTYGSSPWATRTFATEKFGYADWKDFLLKCEVLTIKRQTILTSFANKIGRDIISIDGKQYQKEVIIKWHEVK